jgi:hypothetical protein
MSRVVRIAQDILYEEPGTSLLASATSPIGSRPAARGGQRVRRGAGLVDGGLDTLELHVFSTKRQP